MFRSGLMRGPPGGDDKAAVVVAGDLAAAPRQLQLHALPGAGHERHLGRPPARQGAAPGTLAEKGDILLQAQTVVRHQLGVGRPYIAEVPRLVGDAGDGLLSRLVPQDKAVPGRQAAKDPAGAVIGKGGADKVDVPGGLAQVNGKTGLMLAAAGQSHVLAGEDPAPFGQRLVPDALLLRAAAPAGDRHNLPLSARFLNAGGQQPGRLAVQQDVRAAVVHSGEGAGRLPPEGVGLIDQDQRSHGHPGPGQQGLHSSTPS